MKDGRSFKPRVVLPLADASRVLEEVVQGLALGRLGETDDIVNMAKYLASDEGRWITGQTVRVDGGDVLLPA